MMSKSSIAKNLAFLVLLQAGFYIKFCIATSVCTSCAGVLEGEVKILCEAEPSIQFNGRCCSLNTIVIGADFHGCNINESDITSILKELPKLKYIALEDNPIGNVSPEYINDEKELVYLSLPGQLQCPGGPAAWNISTVDAKKTVCQGLLNPCDYNNVTCPDNSHCTKGEGLFSTECNCDAGYHGYKCLKKGDFPLVPYILGLSIPSVVFCVILWFTQRRYVVKKQN